MCKLLKINWSGRVDSNHRPPGPEPAYINNLQTSPTETKRVTRVLFGPYLDPEGERVANRAALGPCSDPGFHVRVSVAFTRARSRCRPKNLTKICCSDRISKSPYRRPAQHGCSMWRCGILRACIVREA